ncbi:E3 SUMO-protein ligase SIZ1 isoform X3 [Physcomitrium patens]|uniref:E3 SUMO-protein ligase SIZ1 isoform X3 n=1 Tax=Physcomitrium patens TaxID=3218 RepID=UPI000D17483F|nr:E3 SUMO-protein ligase SIZ1-like isoform X2 [Physcomitrium patens]|eukprot:XP_024382422.1 E3 SUMO-protein ligase SIZ1-like isoform X2 [Physcomitrella patens]
MADLASRCRNQLGSFRIRELKDVLARLGLPKQGKKQILMEKIMGLINPVEKQSLTKGSKSSKKVVSREEAIAVIDEQYRKLRNSGAELSRYKSAKSGSSSVYPSAGHEERRVHDETKVHCPCGSSVETGKMIQCVEPKCRIRQHMSCVVFPENTVDGDAVVMPPNFYCELCRISRGDPFCVAVSHPLLPVKLLSSTVKTDGTNTLQNIDQQFTLSAADHGLLQKPHHDLQVWCVLLCDKVSFRMHWPSYADLRVNGMNVRVTNRPGQQLLGANGRDEGPSIAACTREGINRLIMSSYDARPFCLGVRIIRRRSLEEVVSIIPSERDGEPFEEAMARVRRCINGGGGQGLGADGDGSDSDLEVVAESISVNLRCPMSGSRIKVAGRFKPCLHMGCFDLDTYVEMNQRARKWQCPICLKNYSIEHLIIDPFFNRITNAVRTLDEDITEVELKADGFWRPKLEGNARNGEPWRPSPAAAAAAVTNGIKSVPVLFPNHHIKVEEGLSSHDHRALRFRRTSEGQWALNGTRRLNANPNHQVMPLARLSRSSSATDSNLKGDEDEHSVNQDPSEKNVMFMDDNDDAEYSSKPRNEPGVTWQTSCDEPANGADVIVLSDTDDEGAEEEAVVGSSGASMYAESDVGNGRVRSSEVSIRNDTNGDSSGLALGLDSTDVTLASNSACLTFGSLLSTRVPDEGTSNNSGLGLQLDNNSFWTVPAAIPRYYGTPAETVGLQRPSLVRPTPLQAGAGPGFLSTSLVRNDSLQSGWKSFRESHAPIHYGITDGCSMDNDTTASPLQNFLPAQPARAEVQENLREPFLPEEDIDNSWFSLSLGGGENLVKSTPTQNPRTSSMERYSPILQPRVAEIDPQGRVILPQTAILFLLSRQLLLCSEAYSSLLGIEGAWQASTFGDFASYHAQFLVYYATLRT